MTPEVKKRIEQIQQGIVPEGYKKTESGIIPNEWRVGQVSKCIEEYKFFSNDISHIPVYSSSRKGLVPQSDYYNQREAVETNLGYKVVPQGYVTYRHMSDDDVFHFNINKTGENVLVSSEYPVFTSSDNCDLSFLISVLNNTARFRYFCKMQKLGGTRTRLYLDNLKRYALALPPFDEQKKIAAILSTQDKAIELQGRKIEELKRFKKGCLRKMFPRKGQKVPEKRFPGFTDDWEQRKLEEIVERITRKNENLESTLPLTISAQYGLIDQNEFFDKRIASKDVSGYFLVKNGEFAYNKSTSSDAPWGAIKRLDRYESGVLSTLYIVFKILDERKTSSDYIVTYYNTDLWHKGIQAIAAEGARNHGLLNVAPADFFETNLTMPKDYAEQQQIGSFFQQLDSLITLHQRKLEEMKRRKKALMQLLLMGIVRVKA